MGKEELGNYNEEFSNYKFPEETKNNNQISETQSEEISHDEELETSPKEEVFDIEKSVDIDKSERITAGLFKEGVLKRQIIDNQEIVLFDRSKFDRILHRNGGLRLGVMYFTRPELLHAISDITVHEQIHGEDKFIEKPLINFPKTIDDVKNYQDLEHGAVLHLSDIFRSIDYKIFKKLILSDGSKVNFNKLLTMSYLGDRYVPYDFTLPEEANFQRLKVIEFLQQEDILNIDQSKKCFAVDVEKLKSLLQNKKRVGGSFTRVRQYLALALKNLKGYEGVDVNTDIEQKDIKEILPIPEDVNEMMSRAYVKRCDDAMYKPWEFAPPIGNGWVRSVRLQSGEKTNRAELAITVNAQKLGLHRIHRDLYLIDPDTKQRTKFSADKLLKYSNLPGITGAVYDNGKLSQRIVFKESPRDFLNTFLSNIKKHGLLKDTDFKTLLSSGTYEKYGSDERPVTNSSPYVGLETLDGASVKYYIGKSNIIGTKIPIGSNDTTVKLLDRNTAGVYQEKKQGEKSLVAYFPLLTKEESVNLAENIRERKTAQGKPFQAADITYGGEDMEDRMNEYSVTDFIFQRADESTNDFINRQEKLKDSNSVTRTLAAFLGTSGVPTHTMAWAEQVSLAGIVQEKNYSKSLFDFAKSFGISGLKVLTTADYDSSLVDKVLELSKEKPQYLKMLSEGYSKFTENSYKIRNLLSSQELNNVFPDAHLSKRFPMEFQEALLRRAKDLILATDTVKNQEEGESHVQVFEALNLLSEVLVNLFNDGDKFTFEVESQQGNSVVIQTKDKNTNLEYRLKLFVRPESSQEGQARINLELDFNTKSPNEKLREIFRQTIQSPQKNKTREQTVLRVGIDLEDNTDEPQISLDLGRSPYDSPTMVRSGDKLGQLLSEVSAAGSHSQDSFAKVYAPYFKDLATVFQTAIEEKVKNLSKQ